jgi:hypothetical protein
LINVPVQLPKLVFTGLALTDIIPTPVMPGEIAPAGGGTFPGLISSRTTIPGKFSEPALSAVAWA